MVTRFNARPHTGFFNCRLYSVPPTIVGVLAFSLFFFCGGVQFYRSEVVRNRCVHFGFKSMILQPKQTYIGIDVLFRDI